MARLIDADALGIGKARREVFDKPEYADGWNAVIEIIDNAPTVDAEPVVRCGQCNRFESCELGRLWLGADGFCSDGERRNDG